MVINFRSLHLILLFFCLAGVLFGQENTDRKHRIIWTKDEYAMQYEVLIEKEENQRYNNVLREFTEEPFIFISLPPGNYRLRVIPYDFRDVPGKGSDWKSFKILAPASKDNKDTESQLVMEDASQFQGEAVVAEDQTEDQTEQAELKVVGYRGFFLGAFAEGLGYSPYGTAYGFGLVFGGSGYKKGLGISLLYAWDKEGFIFFETLVHLRFYLFGSINNTGLFLQAEGGIVLFAYEDLGITGYWSLVGGIRAGWRIPIGKIYIEPSIHGGYPYMFGAGLSLGMRFDNAMYGSK